jgi:hypothetical protein
MRMLEAHEIEDVTGGFRLITSAGVLMAWAWSQRGELLVIVEAARAQNDRLNAQH